MLESYKFLDPEDYYRKHVENNIRPDGRKFDEQRLINLETGAVTTVEGSVTVRVGNTRVICGVRAEIGTPDLRKFDEGYLIPNIEMSPCCSSKQNIQSQKGLPTTHMLDMVVKRSKLLDLKTLCIVEKKFCWCLYCDIICFDYDGNMVDAAMLALVGALRNVKLPKMIYDADNESLKSSLERTEQLCLQATPTSHTFSIYSPNVELLDPNAEDEERCSALITIIMKENGNLCGLHKSGGVVIGQDTLSKLIAISQNRSKNLIALLNENSLCESNS